MTIRVTREQVDSAKAILALDKAEGRDSDEWTVRLENAVEPARETGGTNRVTREQAGAAKIILALDKVDGSHERPVDSSPGERRRADGEVVQ